MTGCGGPAQTPPPQLARDVPEFPLWGFDSGTGLGVLPVEDLVEDIDRAADLGASSVRIVIRWAWLEPGPGGLDPERSAEVDRLMAAARRREVGVIVTLAFTPCWASTAPRRPDRGCIVGHPLYPPHDPETYGAFVDRVVTRWGEGLAGLEVWNEPNRPGFWRGTPAEYLALVRSATEAVRLTPYADLPVAGGAISGADLPYLRELLDGGLAEMVDAISIHPYDVRWRTTGFGDPSVPRPGDLSSFAFAVPQVRALMTELGVSDPIWITEFGYATCPATPQCVAPEVQADYLRKGIEVAAGWPFVDVFLVFRLRDAAPHHGGIGARFGVFAESGAPKPAARSVGRVLRKLTR